MGSWFLAPSLIKLRHQVNELAPGRSMRSDGSIGDRAHASRRSDHNPDQWGAVRAIDITDDPSKGCSAEEIAGWLQEGKDGRVKYVIWNRQKMRSYRYGRFKPWEWAPYRGSNPHTKHIHISVRPERQLYNDSGRWDLEGDFMDKDFLKGDDGRPLTGHILKTVSRKLNKVLGTDIPADGKMSPELRDGIVRFNRGYGFLPNDEVLTVRAAILLGLR